MNDIFSHGSHGVQVFSKERRDERAKELKVRLSPDWLTACLFVKFVALDWVSGL